MDKIRHNRLALLMLAIVVALPLSLWSAPSNVSAAPGLTITGDVIQLWCEENTGSNPGIFPYDIPDLDGDGKRDVLVRMWAGPSDNRTATVIAKRGYDGHHLWQESITGEDAQVVSQSAGYLDGDDKYDLLVSMWAGPSDNRTATVIAKRGYDGHHLWQESITGQNAFAAGSAAPDFDGGGIDDVLVHMLSGPSDNRTATLIAKRGYDGHHLWQESITGQNAVIAGTLAPDLDGDGKYDVLVRMSAGPSANVTATLIAKRGYDGHHLWQESITGQYAVIAGSAAPDLDGDGKYDALVRMWAGPSANVTATLIAKRGYDGHHLWQESITGEDAQAVLQGTGYLDGDDKYDLLVNMSAGPSDNKTATLIAKRSYDGHHLWQESITGENALIAGTAAPDLDGDDKSDVLVRMSAGPSDNKTATLIAKRGYDGHHLWQETITDQNAQISVGGGDLDGDGIDDVLVNMSAGPSDNKTATVIAKRGYDGHHLWQETITGEDAVIVGATTPDLAGGGIDDVLVHMSAGTSDNKTATVIAKRGYDGHHLWQETITGENAVIVGSGGYDLEGDRAWNDVLVSMEVGPSDNKTATVIAKRGYDGHHLWQETITGEDASATNWILDVNCDNKSEVIVRFMAGPSSNRTGTFIAKKPPDGSHLWQWQAQSDSNMTVRQINDLDGDGKRDILIYTSSSICALALLHCPTVTSVNPAQGMQGETLDVTITGTKFTGATVVSFGDGMTVNSFTVDSDTQIRVSITIAPSATPGARDVSVMAQGGSDTLTGGFTVQQSTQSGSVATATGTGTATFTTSSGSITGLTAIAQSALTCTGNPGTTFPHGFFSFNITNIAPGSTVTITITLPSNMPAGTQYWKCQNGQWVNVTSLLSSNDGDNVLNLTLTDGGLGDGDGAANGTIVDPGGPAVVTVAPPQSPGRSSPPLYQPARRNAGAILSTKYLNVSAQQAAAGQPVTITSNVVNTGDEAGNYNVILKINGQVEETRMVSVGPQGTQPVKFIVSKAHPGTYTVDIGGDRASFTVVGTGGRPSGGISNSLIVASAILVFVALFSLLAVIVRKRLHAY